MSQYCPSCGRYHESITGGCFVNNFVQVIPDSQYFNSLEQIESYAQSIGDNYLKIAIQNTIENGYKLNTGGTPKAPDLAPFSGAKNDLSN